MKEDNLEDSAECLDSNLMKTIESSFGKSELISLRAQNRLSFILQDASKGQKYKKEISIRQKQSSIIIQASFIQKIAEPRSHQREFYLNKTQIINKSLCSCDVVFWIEKNQNFGVRRVLSFQSLKQCQLNSEKFFKKSVSQMQYLLNSCLDEVIGSEKEQNQNKNLQIGLQKRIDMLNHLKFQFQVNRKRRQKATSIDFNNYSFKSVLQLKAIKEKGRREGKNIKEILCQHQARSTINKQHASTAYNKCFQAYKRRQNEKKIKMAMQQADKILNPIKIRTCRQTGQLLDGTFSHIEVVQSQFSIIFSLNIKTNEQLAQQKKAKELSCTLIKKKKCSGCQGETQSRKKVNKTVFQNEKEMLLLMNPYAHDSICNFYIEQYVEKKFINQIYSKKLPSDPITRFFHGFKVQNTLKWIAHILKFCCEVAEGIQFLSSHEILHRDLKPTNVMLDQNNIAKIIDFGSSCPTIGSALQHNLTQNFDFKLRSTRGYFQSFNDLPAEISSKYTKEQYERHSNFDVYSLGAILQFLLPNNPKFTVTYSVQLLQFISYFIKKCKDIHPDDRLLAIEAVLFLKELTLLARRILYPANH